MFMKKYIKMNKNTDQLSLGNFCDEVKKLAKNKNAALQSQIFTIIFDIDTASDTAINNYCIGLRSINSDYKEIYLKYKKRYNEDKCSMIYTVNHIISILNGQIYDTSEIKDINNEPLFIELSLRLYTIAKNDVSLDDLLITTLNNNIKSKNYYDFICNTLFFIVLDKKQPVFINELNYNVIDKLLNKTNIPSNDLEKYLNLKFTEGINYYHLLQQLASNNNAYAALELATNEFKGYTIGKPRYNLSYDYYMIAANQNHSNALYMIGKLIIYNYVDKQNKDKGLEYLLKAKDLGSIAATSTIAHMYKEGITPLNKDISKAIKLFNLASSSNYPYADNNLGKIYEELKDDDKALYHYKKSADNGESYGANKTGLYYINKDDYENAYIYFNKGINTEILNTCYYNYYNLAKYFYENGNKETNTIKNSDLAKEYYLIASNYNNYESMIRLLYIYTNEYLCDRTELLRSKIYVLVSKIETHDKFNKEEKNKIDNELKKIKNNLTININDFFE